MRRYVPLLLLLVMVAGACSGSSSADGDAAGGCSSDVFVARPDAPASGVVARLADPSSGHTAGEWSAGDFRHARAVQVSETSWTTYISDQPIAGFTVEAPQGGVVVTTFISSTEAELAPGLTLPLTFTIVDNSGNARSNAQGGDGEVTIVEFTDSHLCFDIQYTDDMQEVDGRISIDR